MWFLTNPPLWIFRGFSAGHECPDVFQSFLTPHLATSLKIHIIQHPTKALLPRSHGVGLHHEWGNVFLQKIKIWFFTQKHNQPHSVSELLTLSSCSGLVQWTGELRLSEGLFTVITSSSNSALIFPSLRAALFKLLRKGGGPLRSPSSCNIHTFRKGLAAGGGAFWS